MAITPYPVLDGRGYLHDVGQIADAIFADYYQTQDNQSENLKVRSINAALSKSTTPQAAAQAIESDLQQLLSSYIDGATCTVTVTRDRSNGYYGLRVAMSVTDNGSKVDLGRLIRTNGTATELIGIVSRNGEVIQYPIEKRDINIYK